LVVLEHGRHELEIEKCANPRNDAFGISGQIFMSILEVAPWAEHCSSSSSSLHLMPPVENGVLHPVWAEGSLGKGQRDIASVANGVDKARFGEEGRDEWKVDCVARGLIRVAWLLTSRSKQGVDSSDSVCKVSRSRQNVTQRCLRKLPTPKSAMSLEGSKQALAIDSVVR
jgi:hypothetical protein